MIIYIRIIIIFLHKNEINFEDFVIYDYDDYDKNKDKVKDKWIKG